MDRQHHQGGGGGDVEHGRGEEGHAQHAHGAPAQFGGGGGKRRGLVLGAAGQHDGGDAADAVEEARLQPRQGEELAAGRGGGADAGGGHADRHQQPGQPEHQHGKGIGAEGHDQHQQRPGQRQRRGRQPAGEQPVQRLHLVDDDRGEVARVPPAQHHRSGVQQAGQRVGAQAAPRRRAGGEGVALGRHLGEHPQHGQHSEAGAGRKQHAANTRGQRRAEHHGDAIRLTDRAGGAGEPCEHHRQSGFPAVPGFRPEPGFRSGLAVHGLPVRHRPGIKAPSGACPGGPYASGG